MVNKDMVGSLHSSANQFDGTYSRTSITVTLAAALALYNTLELLLLILTIFRKFKGWYFWSIMVATVGVLGYITGALVLYFELGVQLVGLTIRVLSWPAMVTGQSFVLYSRLSVVLGRGWDKLRKGVLCMIILNGTIHHGTTIILTFGAYYTSPGPSWLKAFDTEHKIQRMCFTIQECTLSGLYIWRALVAVQESSILRNRKRTSLIMWQLIAINVVILVLDIFVIVDEFTTLQAVNQAVKAMIYSIKLKLEFAILGKLSDVFGSREQSNMLVGASPETGRPSIQAKRTSSSSVGLLQGFLFRKASIDIEKAQTECRETSFTTLPASPGLIEPASMVHLDIPQPTLTVDERRRRRTLEENMYAGACRDMMK